MSESTVRPTERQAAASNAEAATMVQSAPSPQNRTDPGHNLAASNTPLAALKRARFKGLERVKRFVRSPLTQLIVAIILIVTSVIEASETFMQDFYSFKLRASHGLLVVGIVQVLAAIPDLIEGLERYLESAGEEGTGASLP